MKISADLKLSKTEETQLAAILRVQASQTLNGVLEAYAEAAIEEYVRMFLGQRVFTRGSDMREFRLFMLIRFAFGNLIPDEQLVCALFQCTLSQSRALLRAVMSKYQYDLSTAIEQTLENVVSQVEPGPNDEYLVTVKNEIVVAELNKVLVSMPGAQDEITKVSGKLDVYKLQDAAYFALCDKYEITRK